MVKKQPIILFICIGAALFSASCAITDFFQKDETVEQEPAHVVEFIETECEDLFCPAPEAAEIIPEDLDAPTMIVGSFEYSNEFYPEGYAEEHAVGMFDMTGFILRDTEWVIPATSQVLGYCELDEDSNSAEFQLLLPAQPNGTLNDVDQDGEEETGVQVYALEYAPNWTGGPFYAGDDEFWGWPGYLASITTDSENQDEVIGGKLIIWAPDAMQSFPSGFGDDGLLFTSDDPVMDVPVGYSLIDLDQEPFEIIREKTLEIVLIEPDDAAIKDFSDLSYTDAFDQMFEIIQKEYAFNGIEGKQPIWDTLYDEIQPKIEKAENTSDPYGFYLAMREFAFAFKDGHVSLDGGDWEGQWVGQNIYGAYGLAIRELDDGRVIIVYVQEDSPAEEAGIQVGAELISFKGKPIADVIAETEPYGPQSTDFGLRYEQTVFALRVPMDTFAEFEFINPGKTTPQTEELQAIIEFESLYATYLGGEYDEYVLPIEYDILEDDWVGYIKINSNSDDLNMGYRIYEKALKDFEEAEVNGIIIDMRLDFGGTPYNLAGYLTDQEIPMGQLEYYNENTGQFEPEGDPTIYTAMTRTYDFPKMVLLVDQFCFSACELDAYALSQVDGMVVIGEFPTAGVEAETARGKFDLPEGISFGVPTGRFTLEDGSILLEGQGVQPDIDLDVTFESVLSDEDVVLEAALDEVFR